MAKATAKATKATAKTKISISTDEIQTLFKKGKLLIASDFGLVELNWLGYSSPIAPKIRVFIGIREW